MKLDGGLLLFTAVFALIIVASFAVGSYDQIAPVAARSQAEMAIGRDTVSGISVGMSWLFKLALGSFFTGIGIALVHELIKTYRLFKRQVRNKRWQGGPNANWQGSMQQQPRVTKNDLMFYSLLNGRRHTNLPLLTKPADEDDDDLHIEV